MTLKKYSSVDENLGFGNMCVWSICSVSNYSIRRLRGTYYSADRQEADCCEILGLTRLLVLQLEFLVYISIRDGGLTNRSSVAVSGIAKSGLYFLVTSRKAGDILFSTHD